MALQAKKKKKKTTTPLLSSAVSKPAEPRQKRRKLAAQESGQKLEDMSMDDFLEGGFLAATGTAAQRQGPPARKKQRGGSRNAGAAVLANGARPSDGGEEAPTAVPPGKASATKRHKAQLAALRERDPEFYNYLEQADRELLDFGAEAGESEGGSGSDPADNDEPEDSSSDEDVRGGAATALEVRSTSNRQAQEPSAGSRILDQAAVEKWCREAKGQNSMGALARLMKAYRVACHLGDEEDDLAATMRIVSSTVFNKLLIFMVKEAGGIFRKHLGLPAGRITAEAAKRSPRWRKVEGMIKSYLGNSLHLLVEQTDEAMVVFMLRHLRPCTGLLAVSERLQRRLLRHLLQLFGRAGDAARLQAAVFVREMALTLPPPMLSLAMKGMYRAFVLSTKFMSPDAAPRVDFMATCVVEIFGLDAAAAYEHAFSYVRQLAVLLRGSMSAKTKEAFREVYCWQTISSLELWARLLSVHAGNEELRPLVYPVVQILTGVVRLVPTARYFPLRLRCVRALNALADATRLFVPVAPLLLEALQWRGLHTAAKAAPGDGGGGGGAGPSLSAAPQLRAGKQLLGTPGFQQALVEEVLLLLAEHLATWSTSPAFPEMAHIPLLQLRKVAKGSKVTKFRATAQGLMAAIQANAEYVSRARSRLECSPKDSQALSSFLASEAERKQAPMRKYAELLGQKAAKQRALASAGELTVGAGSAPAADDSSDGDELPRAGLFPELREKAASRRAAKGAKGAAPSVPEAAAEEPDDEGGDGEDELRDFVLSESDSE